jgi:hypothetical protein
MKNALLIALFLLAGHCSTAQMTLEHSFPMTFDAKSEIVNLSLSGRKIMTANYHVDSSDTLFFYNMDYSFWKKIICPPIPGYHVDQAIFNSIVLYPSESLFNTDPLLEVAVLYFKLRDTSLGTYVPSSTYFIINENSTLMDSITNVSPQNYTPLQVFETSPGIFKATVSLNTGIGVYRLPGTIPCSVCGNALGISKVEKSEIPTEPIPNPSSNCIFRRC